MKMLNVKNKNEKEYCGKCLVCKKIKSSEEIENKTIENLPKIYRLMYEENICFTTMNKLSRDKRYKDNIRVENKYTIKKKKKVDNPPKPQTRRN